MSAAQLEILSVAVAAAPSGRDTPATSFFFSAMANATQSLQGQEDNMSHFKFTLCIVLGIACCMTGVGIPVGLFFFLVAVLGSICDGE